MLLHITLELVLAVAVLFLSATFWEGLKTRKYFIAAIWDPPEGLISRETLANPPSIVSLYAENTKTIASGYALNIMAVLRRGKRGTMPLLVLIVAILIGSYFLGVAYLVINAVLSLLTSLIPLCRRAKVSAMEDVLALALILHKWRLDNSTECDQWIEVACNLRPVYEAVKKAKANNGRVSKDVEDFYLVGVLDATRAAKGRRLTDDETEAIGYVVQARLKRARREANEDSGRST